MLQLTVGIGLIFLVLGKNCALSPSVGGGGWMHHLMKATRGSTFGYNSSYWTSANVTNESDMSRSDADAKYDVFNYYSASSFLAIFPDMNNEGQTSGYGWMELVT